MKINKKAALHNLGCKVNAYETEAMQQILENAGYEIVPFTEYADVYVVNTCSVTNMADRKSRQMLHKAKKMNPDAIVVGAGCYVQTKEAEALLDDTVDIVIGNNKKHELLAMLEAYENDHGKCGNVIDINHEKQEYEEMFLERTAEHTRAFIKVQDGCNNACTYCIVHVARGRAVSRPLDEIVGECAAYARAGVKEIVLTGINLGSYLQSASSGRRLRLAGLLERLLDETASLHDEGDPACRFRISSIEPRDVDDDLIALLADAHGRVCRHLHLPLQAGSSKVLREMARPYDAAFFLDLVMRLRETVPALSLSTDIIAGFPGETEDEFEETLSVARACGFSKIHAFPYSIRQGTPAAERRDQIAPDVKDERAARLRALAEELRRRDFARRVGSRELVLVEQEGRGMTESYFEVPVAGAAPTGSLVELPLSEMLA